MLSHGRSIERDEVSPRDHPERNSYLPLASCIEEADCDESDDDEEEEEEFHPHDPADIRGGRILLSQQMIAGNHLRSVTHSGGPHVLLLEYISDPVSVRFAFEIFARSIPIFSRRELRSVGVLSGVKDPSARYAIS
jgi:hypothetical protein